MLNRDYLFIYSSKFIIFLINSLYAGQLNECCDKLKKLRAQLRKYEELLAEANNQVCAPPLHPTVRTNGSAPTQATRYCIHFTGVDVPVTLI